MDSHYQFGPKMVIILLESEETLIYSVIHSCRNVAPKEPYFPLSRDRESLAFPGFVLPEWKSFLNLFWRTAVVGGQGGVRELYPEKAFMENKM